MLNSLLPLTGPSRCFTIRTLAFYADMCERGIYRAMKEGRLRPTKIGR